MHRIIWFLIIFLISSVSFAQQFGGNPPSRKWNQINTDTARIIFPEGRDSQANRVASIVHYMASSKPLSLGEQLKKINIVLQDQTIIPNGYVQLGPYRSEFFLTPDLDNFNQGSIPWADQLAIHEYRHIQQFNNFNNGISKWMRILFGQEGYALAINAAVPEWFYEGDAVHHETILTRQGRGRIPRFLNSYPALWQAGKNYSWMKLRNGSFKDFVPNHYELGYLLVKYGHEKYGADFWKKVTIDASAYKGLIYPWQVAIKKHAGVSYKTFLKEAEASYKKNTERVSISRDDYLFPVNNKYVVNYTFPYAAGVDSLIYLKSGYRERPTFYIKDAQGEHKLRVKDISLGNQFSYRNGKIIYAAYENHPRWRWQDQNVLKILDIHTGEQTSLGSKAKYFTPDISPDGSKVAAVQVPESGKSELHILDINDGKVIQAIHSSEINLFTDPKFMDEQTVITAVRLQDGRMALATAEIASGVTMRLTPPSFNVVGFPSINNGIVYFTASYEGNDDVFALKLKEKKIYRISDGPLGNYNVNAGFGKITWSSFTAEGYQLKEINENDIVWKEVSATILEKFSEKFPVASVDQFSTALENIGDRSFEQEKYKKSTGLFNFHSWRPYYEDPIVTFSLYGENVLNTFQTELYYLYNDDENTSAIGFGGIYGGWFPFLSFGTEMTFDRQTPVGNRLRRWNQLDTRVGAIIPLQWTSGRTFKNFSVGSNYVLRNEFNKDFYKDSIGNTSFSYLLHNISWSQQVQRALQDIYPRFAYSLSASHRHAITRYDGWQFNSGASLYLPGIIVSHNFQFLANLQERDTLARINFGNRFAYSRGYTGRNFSRMWRLSANYHLPLLYPDMGFANILFLQRVRANVFYDFTKVYSRDKTITANQQSVGGELFIDTKWWNQYPLSFGFRVSRLLDNDQFDGFKRTVFEFVLPVSIIPR